MWRTPPGQTPAPVIGHQRRVKPFNDALPRPYHLWTLARFLKDAGMTRVNPIVGASTPIIKFEDPQGPTQCDLNVNDLGGW
jgi:hypothetical protein